MTRVVAQWVPKPLPKRTKRERERVSRNSLKSWRSEKNVLYRIDTPDEMS